MTDVHECVQTAIKSWYLKTQVTWFGSRQQLQKITRGGRHPFIFSNRRQYIA